MILSQTFDKFSKLCLDSMGAGDPDEHGFKIDTGETGHIAEQLKFVFTEMYRKEYPENKARKFIPVNTRVPSGAKTYSYCMWDLIGMAQFISDYASDIEAADATCTEVIAKTEGIASSYHYTLMDLRSAEMSKSGLDQQKADAARMAIDNKIDAVAATGDTARNIPGFLNNANVTLVTPDTGNWATATVLQILEDLRKMQRTLIAATKGSIVPDTVLFDQASWDIVTNREMSVDTGETILQRFLKTSPYVKNADVWHVQDTADVAGTGPRIVMYARQPRVLELVIPQDFEQFPPQVKNLAWTVLVHARVGGVSVKYPIAMVYMDGV
jgi:hypothetical protein